MEISHPPKKESSGDYKGHMMNMFFYFSLYFSLFDPSNCDEPPSTPFCFASWPVARRHGNALPTKDENLVATMGADNVLILLCCVSKARKNTL